MKREGCGIRFIHRGGGNKNKQAVYKSLHAELFGPALEEAKQVRRAHETGHHHDESKTRFPRAEEVKNALDPTLVFMWKSFS